MDPQRYEQVGQWFRELLPLSDDERIQALENLGEQDPALRQEVSRLLELDEKDSDPFADENGSAGAQWLASEIITPNSPKAPHIQGYRITRILGEGGGA